MEEFILLAYRKGHSHDKYIPPFLHQSQISSLISLLFDFSCLSLIMNSPKEISSDRKKIDLQFPFEISNINSLFLNPRVAGAFHFDKYTFFSDLSTT